MADVGFHNYLDTGFYR